jgi:hypothetical protein
MTVVPTTQTLIDISNRTVSSSAGALLREMRWFGWHWGGYPMEVWIGSDGLVHQLQFAIDTHPAAASSSAAASPAASAAAPADLSIMATIELYDYGSAVSVVAPAADQTSDLTGEIASASP